jgi:ArsR family transcriptional regulator
VAEETCLFAAEGAAEEARKHLVDEALAADLAAFYGALADPTRVRIVSALRKGELCVGDLVALLEKSQPAISHQLRILRSLRLVRAHRRGRRVFYTLDDDHVRVLFEQGLEHLAVERPG